MDGGFEILINGVPRTFRDLKELAIYAGRELKRRNFAAEIMVVNVATREWALVADVTAPPTWHPAPSA
jgi:hypothetical protein